jgi:hypothetical protein
MRQRLARLRRVAAIAHDQHIIDLVTQTADEIEADIRRIEAGKSERVTLHLRPPRQE